MMTRKHYQLVAEAIKKSKDRLEVISNLNNAFEEDNDRFDRQVFTEACAIHYLCGRSASTLQSSWEDYLDTHNQ